MSKKEKPLPRPPKTPFGKRRSEENEEGAPLMADRMAAAMAEGRLDEFMKEEMPDNEYARALAAMMMGMTGMTLPAGFPRPEGRSDSAGEAEPERKDPPVQPPEDVINTVRSGDVKGVMEILAREHGKRTGGSGPVPAEEKKTAETPGLSDIEKKTLDEIMKIASENRVSVDWMVLRALKLYIAEYRKTGRL